jgi:hypothetical protein
MARMEIGLEMGKSRKRKKKKFDAATEARRRARNSGIAPAVTKVVLDKRKKPPKHKGEWLEQ